MSHRIENTCLSVKSIERYTHTSSLLAASTYFYMQKCGYIFCDKDYFVRRQGLASFLIIYTISGKGYLNFRNKRYELIKDCVMFINCSDAHDYHTDSESLWEFKYLHFNGIGIEGYFNNIYSNLGPVIQMENDQSAVTLISEIIEMKKKKDFQFEIKTSSSIMQLLASITLTIDTRKVEKGVRIHSKQIEDALIFMEANYTKRISLKDIACSAHSSHYHFTRLFKTLTGYSAYEYLIKLRIDKAKSLLTTEQLSIAEISHATGFENPSHFTRSFKTAEGITPLAYRKIWGVMK